jgi:hypothetical protein
MGVADWNANRRQPQMTRARVLTLSSLLLLTAGAVHPATAAEPYQARTVLVSAERLTGVQHSTETSDGAAPGLGSSSSRTSIYALGNVSAVTPFDIPRLAIDVAAADHFTIGGSATLAHIAPESGSNTTIYTVSPRLGAIVAMGPSVSFWARAGVTYYNASSGGTTLSGLGVDLEAMLLFRVAEHFGITAGALADLGVTGSLSTGGTSVDAKYQNYGGSAGLTSWF